MHLSNFQTKKLLCVFKNEKVLQFTTYNFNKIK